MWDFKPAVDKRATASSSDSAGVNSTIALAIAIIKLPKVKCCLKAALAMTSVQRERTR